MELFLSEPRWDKDNGDGEFVGWRKSLLNELESVIWSLMQSGGRSEARLWLCNALSGITSISPRHQHDLFVKLLRSKPTKRCLAGQLLRLIFEKFPRRLGPILSKKSHMLEKFFKGNPRRIMQWFSSFAGSSDLEHGKGAKALSQFAFVNRDICWEELEWKGKHGQSPATVATKPHYFLDLDVQRTVENFIEYVPDFWSSHEFSESLKGGEILFVDTKYFVDLFIDMMYKEDLEEVWGVIDKFLVEESFSVLCHHLLIILEEQDLQLFLDLIGRYLNPENIDYRNPSQCFEMILSRCSGSSSVDQLLLLNAVTNQGRQLLKLVQEEGSQEEKGNIRKLVLQLCDSPSHASSLAPIMKECFSRKTIEAIKWLGLQSWAIHFRLSEAFRTPETLESLFISNGIGFQRAGKYVLVGEDDFSEDYGSDKDCRASSKRRRKKKGKYRKKSRRDLEEIYDDEPLDFDSSNNNMDLQFKAGDWLLSIDGYSTTWSSADLPEYLAKHCFFAWLKWVFAKWERA